MTLSALADRVATLALRRLPPHFSEIRADVWADARRAALDALEAAAGLARADALDEAAADLREFAALLEAVPEIEGHSHEAAYVPASRAICCVRRLPDGEDADGHPKFKRCPVRFRPYLPAPGEAPQTTGEHAWVPFDEADTTPPNGVAAPPTSERLTVPAAADVVTWANMPAPSAGRPPPGVACAGDAYEPDDRHEEHP